ncbi:hypothetical protein CC1G_04117 [Coprinopsis cinerea okayama7|uniref:F-box domain-containing protein n=1 Tax=Coprinopsis cinerea (strain Okayama-7 / 130 / ATCC MYA-4618 / FGSC 9003) TaxID=240176 RepID=A8NW17_COPC7|nr:hypothetical protein CC1G_04117 [Coprinopsis cinerea okayama7\|eukprot:XP_001836804.1 hypothetical protein CC1G_04117 [Coprinopsis cinerea okayama7\
MPALRFLTIQTLNLQAPLRAPSVYPLIERLALTVAYPLAINLASSFPNLTHLRIRMLPSDHGAASHTIVDSIKFALLQNLDLCGDRLIVDLLERIECPEIRELRLAITGGQGMLVGEGLSDIIRFVKGSSKLEQMALSGLLPPTTTVLLESCQEVQVSSLELDMWPYSDSDPPRTLLPRIRKLSIWGIGTFDDDPQEQLRTESFLKYLERRWMEPELVDGGAHGGGVARLEEVVVGKHMLLDQFPDAEVEALRARGMNIVVRENWDSGGDGSLISRGY